MKAKNKTDPVRERADELLRDMGRLFSYQAEAQASLDAQIKTIQKEYAEQLRIIKDQITGYEKELEKLARENRAALFAGKERIDLKHGALLLTIEKRVKRIKKMLAKLKTAGFTDAIKISESVNWDEIEKWDDEKLAAVGTQRVPKENFAYEVAPGAEAQISGTSLSSGGPGRTK